MTEVDVLAILIKLKQHWFKLLISLVLGAIVVLYCFSKPTIEYNMTAGMYVLAGVGVGLVAGLTYLWFWGHKVF